MSDLTPSAEAVASCGVAAGIAGEGRRPGFLSQRIKILDGAGRERDPRAFLGQGARQRGGKARAGADDEGGLVFRHQRSVISNRRSGIRGRKKDEGTVKTCGYRDRGPETIGGHS